MFYVALALATDQLARPMPVWQGCRTLRTEEVFLLADHSLSFDSRYFGPLQTQHIVGRATLLWPPLRPK